MTEHRHARVILAAFIILVLAAGQASAGITVTGANGITATGADGVRYIGTSGITATGADGVLALTPNGITATGADGITDRSANGITATGADGVAYMGANGITATGVDTARIQRADGITATGADGVTVRDASGVVYQADSVVVRDPSGITATGADGITATGADGITATGADSLSIAHANGITATGADSLSVADASGITATGADGAAFAIPAGAVVITGANGIYATGADGVELLGLDGITATGADGITATGVDGRAGLQSVDPELALTLDQATDDSSVNAVVVYHQSPTESDFDDLRAIGVLGGVCYRVLPMIALSATRAQIVAISHLAAVRSIYGVRTLQTNADTSRATTGVTRAWADADLKAALGGVGSSGHGVTVAVLDTGVDGLHPDLNGRVTRNLKLIDPQSASVGFAPPPVPADLPNTDWLYGHGTFVAGVIAGSGASSNGHWRGVAPSAHIVGLSAGDLTLLNVLSGFDYLLDHQQELNVRVVNCSFSANTVFDVHDPVNIATRTLVERGVNVVVSAGNTGPGWNTMNPYAVAPWVIGVGATDSAGRLAGFSSRGDFRSSVFRPKLVAPGVSVVGLRASSSPSVTGVFGVESGVDAETLTASELPYYTTSSGTSFSAPQVAGTVALMLEANPSLTPAEVLDILQRTATPLAPYYQHEVGAGMLNAHAAVLESAFAQRRMGQFRATLDRGQVRFVKDPLRTFLGTVLPGGRFETYVSLPANTVQASFAIAWGPMTTTNDLSLSVTDASGVVQGSSNNLNVLGLTGHRECVAIPDPTAGTWSVRVDHTIAALATSQTVTGAIDVARVEVAPLTDTGTLSAATQAAILRSMRTFVMTPYGAKFGPQRGVSRVDLASALVLGGRVPQYLAGTSMYWDVRDRATRIFVESAQSAPCGQLFPDAGPNGFRPDAGATRLAAAVAIVRAAGLGGQADARAGEVLLGIRDASSIPSQYRGYVAIALERGLLVADGGSFRPQHTLTRAELAGAMSSLMDLFVR